MKTSFCKFSMSGLVICLAMLLPTSSIYVQAQFQNHYGTSSDEAFGKVISNGTDYYVLGQSTSVGSPGVATVSRIDASGQLLWTSHLGIGSQWNDALLTPSGNLMVVGNTLPLNATSASLIGRINMDGGFSFVSRYDSNGRDRFNRIVEQGGAYYVLGSEYQTGQFSTRDDVTLWKFGLNGILNWKKIYFSEEDNEFDKDLVAIPGGGLMLVGNDASNGVIFSTDNNGNMTSEAVGLSSVIWDVDPISTGGYYAVATNSLGQAFVQKFGLALFPLIWEVRLVQLTSVRQVWEGAPGDLYVTGQGSFGGQTRTVIIKLTDGINGPVVDWVKYLHAGTNQTGGSSWRLPGSKLAFADSRVLPGGFGGLCANLSISDLEMSDACLVSNDMLTLELTDPVPNGPVTYIAEELPAPDPVSIVDFVSFNWEQGITCSPLPCAVQLQVAYLNNCGLIEICAIATGAEPYSYQWCSGQSTACLASQLTPCVPTEFCVTVTCSDGTVATATQVVTALDNTPPTITCPGNATVQCGNPTTPAATGTATGTDACGTVTITSTDVFAPACGNTGVITRTWRATDGCGNTATCNQIITIIDSTPPVITCAAQTTPINCPATPVWVAPTATDACSTVPPVITFVDVFVAGNCPGTGTHTRTWRATDACNNTATCSRSIVVQDVTPPVITCAAQTTPINCPATPVWVAPTVTDNCDATPTITFVDAFVAGACAGTGTHTRIWRATDDCGNTATCSRSIVVQDVTAPVITCVAQTTPISCPATPVWVAPTATDACSTVPPVITFVDVFVAGTCPGTGTHTRTWRATDACNNTATCSRSIVVQDVTPPVITCAAQTTPINCPATPVWVAPTVTDNCDATPTITFVDAFVAGACAGTGTHTRTWRATDDCGNTATCSRSIVVQYITPPVITCAAQTTPINCPATPVWVAPTATDACSTVPPVITFVDVFVAGTCPGTGTHTRTWRATDACNNTATCSRSIVVQDVTPPVITCPANITVTGVFNPNGVCTAIVQVPSPMVVDGCDPFVTLTNSFNGTANASGTYPNGITTVTWTATDDCGNTITCVHEVVVICPSQNCPPNCQTNMINISTGADPLIPGSYLAPGGADPMWTLIAAPPTAGLTTPLPAQLIGVFGNAWDQPVSTWLSPFPFNNYGVDNCTAPPQNCSCPPFTYQRCFCICEDGPVTFDFDFWSDNNGKVELWKETAPNSGIYNQVSTLVDNCNNLNAITNFNAPPTGQGYTNPPLSVITTMTLTEGRYCIRIHNWNISGVAMGVNLLGNITGLNLETDQCCSAPTGAICVAKFHDLNCDGVRDFNTSNWTYIDPGLNNWTFNLTSSSGTTSGVTNAQGFVCFTGLPVGIAYTITEVQQAGWNVSTPPNGTITVTPTSFTTTNVEFGNCSDECKCGPYEFLYSIGHGPLLPKYCGDVLYVPDSVPFQFIASYSCIGACTPPVPTVDYVLTGPPGFVTMSMNGVPATPGYSLPIIASTFTIAGTYTLTVTGHCGTNICQPCVLTFIYPGDCCKDQEIFCGNLENFISVSVDNSLCKATLNIGNLPTCDYIEWINWGDNTGIQQGPWLPNSMPMHTYNSSGMKVICYLAIEKDPFTNLICFEKEVCDTIYLSCSDSYCPLNYVQNGDFSVGTATGSDETICLAAFWDGIWPKNQGYSTADLYSNAFPPPGTLPVNAQGNYGGMWVRKQGTQIPWREGMMNELQQTLLPNSGCYELEFKLACTFSYFGSPILNAYGVNATGLASGSLPVDGNVPLNLNIFPSGNTVLLGTYAIPANCSNDFLQQQIVLPIINSNSFPASGITHIFFTRDDGTNGGVYIVLDDICLKEKPCPDSCCTSYENFCNLVAQGFTVVTNPDSCKVTLTSPQFDTCHWFSTPPYLQGEIALQIITDPDGMWMFNFNQSGVYTVCVNVFEENDDSICWQKEMCTTFDLFCDNCCTDSIAFFNAAPNIQTLGALGDCSISFQASLDTCWQISYHWGDLPPFVWDGPHGDNISVSHTYAGSGTYSVCYLLEEVDANGNVCWDYVRCDSVLVLCSDSCCTSLGNFCDHLENNVILSVDNDSCKAILAVNNLPPCDFIQWVDWGDGNQDPGPSNGGMAVHTYAGSGTYNVCYFALELDDNGLICFEKFVCDTITMTCECCTDFNAFCDLVDQGFTVVTNSDSCKATLTSPQFDTCHWFSTPPYLQGGIALQIITDPDGMWMFNFNQSGVYTVCVNVFEENGDSICWQKEMCTTFDLFCDNCCTDSIAFFNAAPGIQTLGTLGDCNLSFQAELDECWQISYHWGDLPPFVWEGPYGNNVGVSHTYADSGTYSVCYLLEEVDENGDICWDYVRCDSVLVLCQDTCVIYPDDLVAWWPMEEQQFDQSAVDIIGSHNGMPQPGGSIGSPDGPDPVTGVVGDALHFTSPGNHHLEVPNHADLNFGAGSFSIDAWINTDMGTQTEPIVDKLGNLNSGYSFSIVGTSPTNSKPTIYIGLTNGTTAVLDGPVITSGQWNFVAVTFNSAQQNQAIFYVGDANGQSLTQFSGNFLGTTNATNSRPLLIGGNPLNPHWNIMIDELEIFDRALDSAEVASIWDAGSFGKCRPTMVDILHLEKATLIRLFPNPTTGLLTLEFKGATPKAGAIQILDLLGRTLLHETLLPGSQRYGFSIDKLPSGVYFVKVLDGGDPIWVQKVVKQ